MEVKEPIYTALGTFVTAYARERVIRSAQKQGNRFIYADTDSLFLLGKDEIQHLDIHDDALGLWGEETPFEQARFLRAKTYFLLYKHAKKKIKKNGYTISVNFRPHKLRVAGMPEKVKKSVRFEEFHKGLVKDGKLLPHQVAGGVSLLPTTFTII